MKRWYAWKTSPELVRFVAISILTYLVTVATQYLANDFADWTDWRKALIGLLVGGLQFVGARVLAYLGEDRAPSRFD